MRTPLQACGSSELYSPGLEHVYFIDPTGDEYETHFGVKPDVLSDNRRMAADEKTWTVNAAKYGKLGPIVNYDMPDTTAKASTPKPNVSYVVSVSIHVSKRLVDCS